MKDLASFCRLRVHPWGLLSAAGAVACGATVFGLLGRVAWFLDLFSHFRVQYLAGLGILGMVFLLAGRRKTAAVFFAFACLNLGMILPFYVGGRSPAPPGARVLRAMLLNVNTHLGDADRVRAAILEVDPDILVLEEISPRWMQDLSLSNAFPYACVQTRNDNFGIGMFSKLRLTDEEVVYAGDAGVPSIVATAEVGPDRLRVVATHPVPPARAEYSRWRDQQLESISDYISSPMPCILLGDLNVTPWSHVFRDLLKRTGFSDSARGWGIQPTWPSGAVLLRIPIDHCLHSSEVSIVNREIGANVGSDHFPLVVDFFIPATRDR